MASSEQVIGYQFGSFVLDLDWGGLLADGEEMPLRPKSFALLGLLAENAGRVISRETITTALWADVFVTENSVTQCISLISVALWAMKRQDYSSPAAAGSPVCAGRASEWR
jgi:DNA-binding winged helix-turn-helix (wHTH) protein